MISSLEILERYPRMLIAICLAFAFRRGPVIATPHPQPDGKPGITRHFFRREYGDFGAAVCVLCTRTHLVWLADICSAFIALMILAAINQRNGMRCRKSIAHGDFTLRLV